MSRIKSIAAAAVSVAIISAPALGSVIVTQGSSAPTYTDFALNFDEPGGPTGVVAPNAFEADYGLTELQAGDGVPQVGDFSGTYGPWVGGGTNSFFGNFGVFLTSANDMTEMSMQVWDPSGPPSPFGGGAAVFVFDDGVEVANFGFEPAWGGIGDTWIDITTSGGMVFDEVRILGFGFSPTTFVDDLSWNVPEPASMMLFGLAGVAVLARRRR